MKINIAFIRARAKEASTWRGLILVLAAFGVEVSPEMSEEIVKLGLALAGVIGLVTKDGNN